MKPTNISDPEYFHQVIDCQYACPSHTPVPEYIRLIAAGRYSDAYMLNWESNVFPACSAELVTGPANPHAVVAVLAMWMNRKNPSRSAA